MISDYRNPKTTQELRQNETAEAEGINVRAKRRDLPSSYDLQSRLQRSWKKHRRTRWK